MATSVYDFTVKEIGGGLIPLRLYKGQVLIVVNTASKCGLAPQLEQLERLYQDYHDQGLAIVGLPSDQFHQELADDSAAAEYCQLHYGVTFPITQRVAVNGKQADPLFKYLKGASHAGMIKWNYTKFLVGRDGQLIHRYSPLTQPNAMEAAIKDALAAPAVWA
ncbi:glutathione peroxidase [Lacticaseibacillus pantheris]|nr:glutathione peroxidase [Lacticaseibacillus pantheris]WKF83938.1 glutathione peroxidase [Lacticaseibacillus pantheris]